MKKVFNWLVKWYENETTNVLKMIARAFGWSLFGICYLFGLDTHLNYYVLAVSILSFDILFLANRKFESNYKTKSFFKNEKTTVESLDLYQVLMAAIKFVAIIPAIIFDSIITFGIASLIMAPVIAYLCKYKPFAPDGAVPSSTETPIWYGVPGFDASGNFTNSDTAVGGMGN